MSNPLPATFGPIITVSPNSRYFRLDGEPWFWVGDTGWLMTIEESEAGITQYLEDRKSKGIRVIQGPIIVNANSVDYNGVLLDREADTLEFDPVRIAKLDWAVKEAGRLGIALFMAMTWGPDGDVYLPDVSKHVEYATMLSSRYNNQQHVNWLPSGEYHKISRPISGWDELGRPIHIIEPVEVPLNATNKARLEAVVAAIVANKHSSQLIAWHPEAWTRPSLDWQAVDNVAYFLQPSASIHQHVYTLGLERGVAQTKPVLNSESAYESGTYTAWYQRQYAWHSAFSGSAGYTYGHNEIWQFNVGWASSLDAEGALDVFGPFKAYMDLHHRESNVPDQSFVISNGDLVGSPNDYISTMRSSDSKTLHVYTANGRDIRLNTNLMASGTLNGTWYNPRTGVESAPFSITRGSDVTINPEGSPGTDNDWVLTIRVSTDVSGKLSVDITLPSTNIDGTSVNSPLKVLLSLRQVNNTSQSMELEAAYDTGTASINGIQSGIYFVRARVRDSNNKLSDFSNEVQVTVDSSVGSNQVSAILKGRTFRKDLNNAPGPRDLTTLGTLDWAYWGRTNATDFDSKSGGTLLNTVDKLTGSEGAFTHFSGSSAGQPLCSWTDGTPTASHSNERDIIYLTTNVAGYGLKMTSGALGAGRKRFVFGWGAYQANIIVKAVLSDASASDHSFTVPSITSGQAWSFETHIVVEADDPTATMTFILEATDTDGNINIQYAYVEDWPYEIVLEDTFTGTNATAMTSHVPTFNLLSSNYTADRNSMLDSVPSPHNTTIQGNKFQLTASTAAVEFITNSRDNRIWVDWEIGGTSGHRIGISPSRDTVNDQQFWINMREPNADYTVYREDPSQTAIVLTTSKTWGLNKNYALEVYRDGNTVQLRADGDIIVTYTDATQVQDANGVSIGVVSITQSVLFDNLVVWRPIKSINLISGIAGSSLPGLVGV